MSLPEIDGRAPVGAAAQTRPARREFSGSGVA
jgi:hypothetical protein